MQPAPVDEPAALATWLPRGVAVLGATLGGLGLILYVAANWAAFGRGGRFALLQFAVVALAAGAAALPRARAPLGLAALLATGALFAFFGQTYQTGADPWQLFALWAILTLPLAFAVRSDALWTPWALVAMTAVALWVHAHAGHRWSFERVDLPVHLAGWALSFAIAAGLRLAPGGGAWSFRAALALAALGVTLTALGGLFHRDVAPHYAAGIGMLAVAAAVLSSRRGFDLFGLSAVALGLNAMVVGGLARGLFDDLRNGDWVLPLLAVGLVAAGLLAATVAGILRLARARVGALP